MPAEAHETLKPLVYVSYAWGDDTEAGKEREGIVDELCKALEKYDRIIVGRDKRRQKIGDSIEGFAADIARADIVLAVVSRKYLRSYHCMVEELHQAYRRTNYAREEFKKKVCLLLLDDASPDIHVSRELSDHWHGLYDEHHSILQKNNPDRTGSPHGWAALDAMRDMINRMIDMLSALTDTVMPRGYAEITRNDFEDLRDLVCRRLQEWRQWRLDRSGFIPKIGEDPPDEQKHSVKNFDQEFLALVLQRGEVLVEDPDWFRRECPWDFHSYVWESWRLKAEKDDYMEESFSEDNGKKNGELRLKIGNYIVASESVGASLAANDRRSTFRDLLQEVLEWMDRNEFAGLFELFVPTELLGFDWSAIKIRSRSEFDPDDCLFERRPYVLRSVDRFCDERLNSQRKEEFPSKFTMMSNSSGRWIAGETALDLAKLKEAETKPELVALKCVSSLDPDPWMRIRWHRGVVQAMVPLAIWWRCSNAGSDRDRQLHLDQVYEGKLRGHSNGDQVLIDCHDLESLPRLRRNALSNPLTKDLVLLLDNPDRHPFPPPDKDQGPPPVRSA